jgi:hypothetical protein
VRDPALAARIAHESGGSPLFAVQLALEDDSAGAASLDELVRAKVARLSEPARRLLVALAAAGQSVELSVAGELAGGDHLREALDALRDARLLRSRDLGGSPGVEVYHDRVGRSVLADLSDDDRRRLCRAVAEALERHGHDDDERLAALFGEAGDPERARVHLERAADRAAAALAFEHAADLYRRALAAGAPRPPLLGRLADALMAAGRAEEAATISLEAAGRADADGARELRIRAAGALLVAGHFERGRAVLEEAVAPLGIRLPAGKLGALARLVWGELRLRLRGLGHALRGEADVAPAALARLDGLWAAIAGFAVANPLFTAALAPGFVRAALDAGEPRRLSRALAARAMTVTLRLGLRGAGAVLLEQAERLAERSGDDAARATVRLARGVVATSEARVDDAIAAFRAAEAMLRAGAAGAHAELGRAQTLRLHNLIVAGRLAAVLAEAPAVLVESDERGNRLHAEWMLAYVAWARTLQGRVDEGAALARDLEARGGTHPFPMLHAFLGFERISRLEAADPAAALAEAEHVWRRARATGLLHSVVVRSQLGFARARLAVAARTASAPALVRRLGREPVVVAAPLADLLAAGLRRDPAALSALEPRLEAVHLDHVVAAVRRARGRALGGDEGRALVARADGWLAEQGVRSPEAWERMFVPGF